MGFDGRFSQKQVRRNLGIGQPGGDVPKYFSFTIGQRFERTREIGIRKALGARRSNLLGQFLIESVVLTGVGGLLGMGAGIGLSQIRIGSAQAVFEPWMGGLALGVSVFIGIVFGVYPANRAARLRPIDALRYE